MRKKIAVVTGAAKGIGKAISKRLVKEGCYVILVDVDKVNGTNTSKELGNDHTKYIYCDISREHEVFTLFKKIIQDYNKIDILINNAGILKDNMIWKMPISDFDDVLQINLRGPWLMCREAAKIMKQQTSGRIVNIASRAWLGNMGQSNYSASKAGLIGLTRVLALELGKYQVYVNAVAPGLIDTPLTQNLSKEIREKLIQAQPTKSMGKPEDVANVVAFLTSDETHFITGQTIYVDGGKSIGAGI